MAVQGALQFGTWGGASDDCTDWMRPICKRAAGRPRESVILEGRVGDRGPMNRGQKDVLNSVYRGHSADGLVRAYYGR